MYQFAAIPLKLHFTFCDGVFQNAEKDQHILQIEGEISALQAKHRTARDELANQDSQLRVTQVNLETAEKQNRHYAGEVARYEETIAQIQTDLDQAREQLKICQDEVRWGVMMMRRRRVVVMMMMMMMMMMVRWLATRRPSLRYRLPGPGQGTAQDMSGWGEMGYHDDEEEDGGGGDNDDDDGDDDDDNDGDGDGDDGDDDDDSD